MIKDIVLELEKTGSHLMVEDGTLKLKSKSSIPADLKRQIKENKSEIIRYLGLSSSTKSSNLDSKRRIVPRSQGSSVPLSYAQHQLWVVDYNESGTSQYNMPRAYIIEGRDFDPLVFEKSIKYVIDRHEILRTVFVMNGDGVEQKILSDYETPIEKIDCSKESKEKQKAFLYDSLEENNKHIFNLSEHIPFKAKIIVMSDHVFGILFNVHHIAADARSMEIVRREIFKVYDEFMKSNRDPLKPLEIQYGDYCIWQKDLLSNGDINKQLDYWKSNLEGAPYLHSLPMDGSRLEQKDFSGGSHSIFLDEKVTKQMDEVCTKHSCTAFMFLQTVFSVLISRYSGQNDVVMGTTMTGCNRQELQSMVGLLVNAIVLRSYVNEDLRFDQFLGHNKEKLLQAFDNQDVPFGMVVSAVNPPRSPYFNPIFQIMFSWPDNQRGEDQKTKQGNVLKPLPKSTFRSKNELELVVKRSGKGITVRWDYRSELFSHETICQMANSFEVAIKEIIENVNIKVCDISLANFKDSLIGDPLTDTVRYNDNKAENVIKFFERNVERRPFDVAVKYGDRELTYSEINTLSLKLANYLVKKNVSSGDAVGICLKTEASAIVSILAVLRIGAYYIPADPDYSLKIVDILSRDKDVGVIIADSSTKDLLSFEEPSETLRIVCLDSDNVAINSVPSSLSPDVRPESAAYISYTSGSFGQPKGVVGTHKSITNRVQWAIKKFPLFSSINHMLSSSISHVDHIPQIFDALCTGGTLCVASAEEKVNHYTPEFILNNDISKINVLPSQLNIILAHQEISRSKLRYVFCSGDSLSPWLAEKCHNELPYVSLYNIYGSAEVGADVSCYKVDRKYQGYEQYFSISSDAHKTSPENAIEVMTEGAVACLESNNSVTKSGVNLDAVKSKFRSTDIPDCPTSFDDYVSYLKKEVIPYSVNVSSSKYIGHMTSSLPSFVPDFAKVVAQLNQNMVKIETSKSFTFLERQVLSMIHKAFYYSSTKINYEDFVQDPEYVFGIVCSGGSTANISALQSARINSLMKLGVSRDDIRKRGANKVSESLGYERDVVLCSPLAHYSIKKAVSLLGLGEDSLIVLDQGDDQKVCARDLERKVNECRNKRWRVFAIVGMAGATETGTVDPLFKMSTVAKRFGIHFHVDASWGGVFVFSEKYSSAISGIELSDSITFCAHKQLYMPQGISLCLFADPGEVQNSAVHAEYQGKLGSFDSGQYTLEGSRPGTVLVLHAALHLLASSGYANLVDHSMEKAHMLKCMIVNSECFELVGDPDINIINYRYVPKRFRNIERPYSDEINEEISTAVEEIQKKQFEDGSSFVSRTKIVNKLFSDKPISVFRVVLCNPRTSINDLERVLTEQARIAECVIDDVSWSDTLLSPPPVSMADVGRDLGSEIVPIGYPIGRNNIYILDDKLRMVPRGAVGEIYIGGDCLCKGYYKDSYLTRKSFLKNPFNPKELLFKSSDLGRLKYDGSVEFVGRCDQRTKVGGHIVSLIEVEKIIYEEPLVDDVYATTYRTAEYDRNIAIFIVLKELEGASAECVVERLQGRVEARLPYITVTPLIKVVDRFPVLPNGKVDRSGLLLSFGLEGHLGSKEINNGEDNIRRSVVQKYYSKLNRTRTIWSDKNATFRMIEEASKVCPDEVAVVFDETRITYDNLNRLSNQWARCINKTFNMPNPIVGIYMDRSLDMLLAVLAVMKAGGAYLPLDPEYPDERIEFMLNDSAASLILTQSHLSDRMAAYKVSVMSVDSSEFDDATSSLSSHNIILNERELPGNHIAYVIYTSGSTGRPKGVCISHDALSNFLLSMQKRPGLRSSDRMLAITTIGFDIAGLELFLPLITGAELHLSPPWLNEDIDKLHKYIDGNNINVMQATPTTWKMLMLNRWRPNGPFKALCGGEAMPKSLVERLNSLEVELWNMYGPTETTIWSSVNRVSTDARIGGPIDNTEFYIFNEHMDLVLPGEAGELYIGGDGLAEGYLNRLELTDERFVYQSVITDKNHKRLYKTGDLVKPCEDGTLEYLGRIDHQVKIRGHRIELMEIEAIVNSAEEVDQCVVMASNNQSGEKDLIAYVVSVNEVSNTEKSDAVSKLVDYQSKFLPPYMVVYKFVFIDCFPLTPNGKIDRKALSDIDIGSSNVSDDMLPRKGVESLLARIWSEVLGVESIGRKDNFYHLGGNSFNVISVISKAKDSGIRLSPRVVMQHPVLESLASKAEEARANSHFYVADLYDPNKIYSLPNRNLLFRGPYCSHFNLSRLIDVKRYDREALISTIEMLISHHEGMRHSFHIDESGEVYEEVAEGPYQGFFESVCLESVRDEEIANEIEATCNEYQKSLDLSCRLYKFVEISLGRSRGYRLLVIVHHSIMDLYSFDIFLDDFSTAYNQLLAGQEPKLPATTTPIRRWSSFLYNYVNSNSKDVMEEVEYWRSLPWDDVGFGVDYEDGWRNNLSSDPSDWGQPILERREISEENTSKLLRAARESQFTVSDIVMTATSSMLSSLTKRSTVRFDMISHGRSQVFDGVDLSRSVGWCVDFVPVVLRVSESLPFLERVKSFREQMERIPNDGLGFNAIKKFSENKEVSEYFSSISDTEFEVNYIPPQNEAKKSSDNTLKFAKEGVGDIVDPRLTQIISPSYIRIEFKGGILSIEWLSRDNIYKSDTLSNALDIWSGEIHSVLEGFVGA